MIDIEKFYTECKNQGIEFYTGVPDSLLNDFCSFLQNNLSKNNHILAANEGNAIAMGVGHYLSTGGVPLVYMQNSGIGNSLNPLLSLANKEMYSIPMILLVGWRGDPSIRDHAQHQLQGRIMPELFHLLNIEYKIMDNNFEVAQKQIEWAVHETKTNSRPVALLVKKDVLSNPKKIEPSKVSNQLLSREEVINIMLDNFSNTTKYVATTGRASRELYHLREFRDEGHENDLLNVGAMGHASSISLGIANGNRQNNVVCLDGDSALIMHLGSLTTIGKHNLDNYFHIVLNNECHESVGGQASAGKYIKLTEIAKNSGLNIVDFKVDMKDTIGRAVNLLDKKSGPKFLEVKIRKGIRKDLPPLNVKSYDELKQLFMKSIREL